MDRRCFVLMSLAAVAAPLVAEAEQAAKVPRVGFISSNPHLVFLETFGIDAAAPDDRRKH